MGDENSVRRLWRRISRRREASGSSGLEIPGLWRCDPFLDIANQVACIIRRRAERKLIDLFLFREQVLVSRLPEACIIPDILSTPSTLAQSRRPTAPMGANEPTTIASVVEETPRKPRSAPP